MAALAVNGDQLELRLSHWEKVGAFHGDVRVPLSAVASLETSANPFGPIRGMRAPGTGWPRRIALGTWRRRGAKDFVAAYRDRPALVVHLRDCAFDRLIVSVVDPDAIVARVRERQAA